MPQLRQLHQGIGLEEYLNRAREVILPTYLTAQANPVDAGSGDLLTGVDLGTAYLTVVVLDKRGMPLAGEYQFAQVSRDGLVVDFIGAVDRLKEIKSRMEARLGRSLTHAASAYPPGVPLSEVRSTGYVLESAGLACSGLLDEPTAANNVLQLKSGAIADIGGGTTGVAVIQDGEVVHTYDEPCGGTHFSLVIAGAQDIPFEEAEQIKLDPARQPALFSSLKPVMEKVGAIILRATQGYDVPHLTLVGGASAFPRMAEVVSQYTSIPASVPSTPLFVTPLGIALHDKS